MRAVVIVAILVGCKQDTPTAHAPPRHEWTGITTDGERSSRDEYLFAGHELLTAFERGAAIDPTTYQQRMAELCQCVPAAKAAQIQALPIDVAFPRPLLVGASGLRCGLIVRDHEMLMSDAVRSIVGADLAVFQAVLTRNGTRADQTVTALLDQVSPPGPPHGDAVEGPRCDASRMAPAN